jgi:hypothetical protein
VHETLDSAGPFVPAAIPALSEHIVDLSTVCLAWSIPSGAIAANPSFAVGRAMLRTMRHRRRAKRNRREATIQGRNVEVGSIAVWSRGVAADVGAHSTWEIEELATERSPGC